MIKLNFFSFLIFLIKFVYEFFYLQILKIYNFIPIGNVSSFLR
jgi:hypothetical protein